VKHLIIKQTHRGVTVKCGAAVKDRADATTWYSEVGCVTCLGGSETASVVKPKRRIVRTPRA